MSAKGREALSEPGIKRQIFTTRAPGSADPNPNKGRAYRAFPQCLRAYNEGYLPADGDGLKPVRPSWRHSACFPSVRYSGSRYLSHIVASSNNVRVAVEHRKVFCHHAFPFPLRYLLNQSSVCCQASLAAASS